jgi:hypothetical protein
VPKLALLFCLFPLFSCGQGIKLPEGLYLARKPVPYDFPVKDRNDVKNPYRYIAHAGGAYNGYTYSDTLEALNSSYRKGFKLFELDIIETKDNELVASHDWDLWKSETGYSGELPPTLSEFKSMPIYGNLTPIGMTDIVSWFGQHTDAILVTDKTENYGQLVNKFTFADRLMVEVFSLADYVKAYNAGIRYPLLSLEAVSAAADGAFMNDFIIGNEVPMAVMHTASVGSFMAEQQSINDNGGYIFAFSSNDLGFFPANSQIFGVYTDFINFMEGKCESTVCASY